MVARLADSSAQRNQQNHYNHRTEVSPRRRRIEEAVRSPLVRCSGLVAGSAPCQRQGACWLFPRILHEFVQERAQLVGVFLVGSSLVMIFLYSRLCLLFSKVRKSATLYLSVRGLPLQGYYFHPFTETCEKYAETKVKLCFHCGTILTNMRGSAI